MRRATPSAPPAGVIKMVGVADDLEITLSIDERVNAQPSPVGTGRLVLAMQCDRPLDPPAMFSLGGVDEVEIGRGDAAVHRREREGAHRLILRVPDLRMSTVHARILRLRDRWVLEDAGSKNGCVISGEKHQRVSLKDGDLLELGHTLFVFRDDGEEWVESAVDPLEPPAPGLATFTPSLAHDFASLVKIAPSEVSVVLLGETGTGKEVVARAIHQLSGRKGDLVAVNCGALPENLLEAELFGHRKGAFSGALEDRPGLIRAADGGTLFLDEIGDMPASSQAALLRVLQEREVTPVGDTRPVKVDVRVIAATHRDLDHLTEKQHFRQDLLARISGLTIDLPPLRERREDLGLIVATLLRRVAPEPTSITLRRAAARAIFRYDWPLNVRELEKCLGAAVVLSDGGRIALEHLPPTLRAFESNGVAAAGEPAALSVTQQHRRDVLDQLLRQHGGNVSAVARAMGKTRTQIHRWIKRYELDVHAYRTA